jgi:hypothetical protein
MHVDQPAITPRVPTKDTFRFETHAHVHPTGDFVHGEYLTAHFLETKGLERLVEGQKFGGSADTK